MPDDTHQWKTLPLEDCMEAIIDYRGKTPTKTDFGIPLVTAKIVKGGRIEPPNEFIAADEYDNWMRRGIPKPGDVVMTTEAPLGEVAQLDGVRVALAQRLITLRGRPNLLDNTFLKFLMQSRFVQSQLKARASGTTVLGIKQSELRKIKLRLPSLGEQRRIATILGNLDEKIEVNRRMNETLEAMARAIFKSWFVDFDPVRAKLDGRKPTGLDPQTAALFPDSFEHVEGQLVPEGWHLKTLGDLAKNASVSFDFASTDDVVFVNTGDVLNGDFLHCNRSEKEGLPGQAKKAIQREDILFSEIRPANRRFAYVDLACDDYVVSTKFMVVRTQGEMQPQLLYRNITSDEALREFHMIAESRSGTFPQITFDAVRYFPIILPTQKVQAAFQAKVDALEQRIKMNKAEMQTLAETRDALLPKLLSGEISVA